MYEVDYSKSAERKLLKIGRKNKTLLEMVYKKIEQIKQEPHHFKPLKAPMQNKRRVHVGDSFVLIYKIDEARKVVAVVDFDHHDKIYE